MCRLQVQDSAFDLFKAHSSMLSEEDAYGKVASKFRGFASCKIQEMISSHLSPKVKFYFEAEILCIDI